MDNVNDEIKNIINDNEQLINRLMIRQKRRLKQLSSVKEFGRTLKLDKAQKSGGFGVDTGKTRPVLLQRRRSSKADELSAGKEKEESTLDINDNDDNKNVIGKEFDKKTLNSTTLTTTTAKK